MNMTLTQILSFLSGLAPVLEPMLLNLADNTLIPDLNSEINKVSSPDVKLLLQSLSAGLQAFADAEIKKL